MFEQLSESIHGLTKEQHEQVLEELCKTHYAVVAKAVATMKLVALSRAAADARKQIETN